MIVRLFLVVINFRVTVHRAGGLIFYAAKFCSVLAAELLRFLSDDIALKGLNLQTDQELKGCLKS